jgi:glucosamine--fructose-6-phosphate aminotransferase (isomerizing)
MAVLSSTGVKVYNAKGAEVSKEPKQVNWNPLMAEKGGYKHFMLKEIFEQPRAVTDTIRGRLSEEKGDVILDNVRLDKEALKKTHRIILIACGTSIMPTGGQVLIEFMPNSKEAHRL